jgi:thioredoxin-like negative regulator of GroEL
VTSFAAQADRARRRDRRPRLVYFFDPQCGRCRRVEGYIASILQSRRNHETFVLARVSSAERPDLVEHFRVERFPTLVVVENGRQFGRLEEPTAVPELQLFLARWLR